MTFSYFRVALVLPLAVGCAHAVYDGQPEGSDLGNSLTEQPVGAGGSSIANNYNGASGALGASAGSPNVVGGGGEASSFGGQSGVAGAGSSAGSSAGATSGGAPGGAGAPTITGGSANAGAASGGAPSAGAPSGGAPGAGAPSGGAPSGGAPSAGAPSTGCSGVPTWKAQTYSAGDQVQGGGKLYQCKPYPYTGWCGGTESFYAPGTGTNWTDAWDLVGPC